jgi:AcrR family transcriptional regulator
MQSGNDAVSDPLVSAATRVFATESTRQVTLKRVALEARVPPDAVSERWSSATDMLASVFQQLTAQIVEPWPPDHAPRRGGELTEDESELVDSIANIIVRASLDGVDVSSLSEHFPIIERMIDRLVRGGADPLTARYRVHQLLVIEFGFRIFAEHLRGMCGLADEPDDRARAEIDAIELLLSDLPTVPAET